MVSLWPGLVKTENVEDGAIEEGRMSERRGFAPGAPQMDFNVFLPTPLAETPLFSGRAVAALARDNGKMRHTGKVVIPSVMASGYGFVDERGVRSPPFMSMKFVLSLVLSPVLKMLGLWEASGLLFGDNPSPSMGMKLYWDTLPDLSLPGILMRLGTGSPNL